VALGYEIKERVAVLLADLREMKPAIESMVLRCGAKHLRVFGSVARRTERPDSEVDFSVDLLRGYDLFTRLMAQTQSPSDLLHRKVDLVPEHELTIRLREDVLRKAVEI
jgi:uncharacterized protein